MYHAAAYKHVPIVEHNMIEGIHNNIFATYNTAEAALECRVETFVLISTDKAVNPTNVMGCTKRVAEMVLQGLQQRSHGTRFCMVRFGNVLESSGSVVPLFREQIRDGGPVTVTHPDVIRYFMTIPEAAQLVIQAGSMGSGGDVFVLDMGSPVRIADLAKRMIQLAGYSVRDDKHPDGDIEIRFTGLAPGREAVRRTAHRQERHRHRTSAHPARHGAQPDLGADAARARRPGQCPRCASIASAPARSCCARCPSTSRPTGSRTMSGCRAGRASAAQCLTDDEKVRELRPRAPA